MPLEEKKSTRGSTRGSTTPTDVQKSRSSNRTASLKPKDNISAGAGQRATSTSIQSSVTGGGSDSDSDDGAKNTEALPASDVTIYNEYAMGPAFGCKFPLPFIRFMVERLLSQKLKGKSYQPNDAVKWVREVADEVNLKMEGLCRQPRYKHVIQTVIYQQNGAGFFCGARAIWDKLSDDYTSCVFDAGTFICIVMVFGVYQY